MPLTLRQFMLVLSASALWGGCLGMKSSHADPSPVRVQINQSIQPYALPAAKSGLLVDIIQAAFASQAMTTQFLFLVNGANWPGYRIHRVDVITNLKPDSRIDAVLSHWPVLTFRNQAITLRSKALVVNQIADLAHFRVIAFRDAGQYLGPEFAEMARQNDRYAELDVMPSRMLQADYTDVIVSIPDVFKYNLSQENKNIMNFTSSDVYEYHDIFKIPNKYWFGFRSEELRDQFERGIAVIYENGEIETIFARYAQQYGTSRDMFIEMDCRFLKSDRPGNCSKLIAP